MDLRAHLDRFHEFPADVTPAALAALRDQVAAEERDQPTASGTLLLAALSCWRQALEADTLAEANDMAGAAVDMFESAQRARNC